MAQRTIRSGRSATTRDLNDIFALQDEISEAIVKALKLKLLPGREEGHRQRGTDNVDAYNLYLMARQNYATGIEQDPKRAEASIRMCRRATEMDPDYARAWAFMALGRCCCISRAGDGGDDGMAAAERALALDADLPRRHRGRGARLSSMAATTRPQPRSRLPCGSIPSRTRSQRVRRVPRIRDSIACTRPSASTRRR